MAATAREREEERKLVDFRKALEQRDWERDGEDWVRWWHKIREIWRETGTGGLGRWMDEHWATGES
eukprot:gene35579-16813_t